MTAGRIGIQVTADEAELFDAASSSPIEFLIGTPGDCGS